MVGEINAAPKPWPPLDKINNVPLNAIPDSKENTRKIIFPKFMYSDKQQKCHEFDFARNTF